MEQPAGRDWRDCPQPPDDHHLVAYYTSALESYPEVFATGDSGEAIRRWRELHPDVEVDDEDLSVFGYSAEAVARSYGIIPCDGDKHVWCLDDITPTLITLKCTCGAKKQKHRD